MPSSFLRLDLHAPYHRRYDLAFDSMFKVYRQLATRETPLESEEIRYYISYIYYTTSRPKHPRMELRLQMTCLVPEQLSSSRLHILHILLMFQLVAQLIETGTLKSSDPDDTTNPYFPDLPILDRRQSFERHFCGSTLFHFTLRSFVRCLQATKYRELGKFSYTFFEIKPFLEGNSPRHLIGVICDAYCLSSRNLEPTNQMQIGISEIQSLLGRLFSAVLSNLTRRGYRFRTHINNTYEEPANERIYLRLLGCLSYETSSLDAEYNRMDRRNKYAYLHSEINSLVSFVIRVTSNSML